VEQAEEMKLKGHIKARNAAIKALLIGGMVACLLWLMGCAGGAVRPDCADDSIVAAQIYSLRTGYKTYVQKSAKGDHAQAYAIINGKHITPARLSALCMVRP